MKYRQMKYEKKLFSLTTKLPPLLKSDFFSFKRPCHSEKNEEKIAQEIVRHYKECIRASALTSLKLYQPFPFRGMN